MGGCFSKGAASELNKMCFICREPINTQLLIRCAFCKMILHPHCEYDFSKEYGNETYCKCPHCTSIGTLVTRPNPRMEQINPIIEPSLPVNSFGFTYNFGLGVGDGDG